MDEQMNEQQNTQPSNKTDKARLRRLWDNYGYLVITAVVVVVLFRGILALAYVPTGSMEPTLPTRSMFLGVRLPYLVGDPAPERGDIVMFYNEELDEVLVKRVIGLPGETVRFDGGHVLIDGVVLEEPYLAAGLATYPVEEGAVYSVPEGHIFLLGDNRGSSLDSRWWGDPYISLSDIQARALVSISLLPGNTWLGIRTLG